MHKPLLVVALLAICCLFFIGCCPPAAEPLTISQVPWPDDEVTSYTIEDQDGVIIGSLELAIL